MISTINRQKELFDDLTIPKVDQMVNLIQEESNNIQMTAKKIEILDFDYLSSNYKMNKIFLLWVDISLQFLMEKNLHVDWIIHLKDQYKELVGIDCDGMDDVLISTCIVWIPSVTVFYLPFSRYPAKIANDEEDSRKRIWKSIANLT